MKKKIIVNADDFGLTVGVSEGIVEAFKNGIVTSTTLMVTQPGAKAAVELSRENPKLGIGLHMTFDKGKALTGVSTLTDENGNLKSSKSLLEPGVKEEDFYKEILAQYEEFKKLMGKEPTHVDSHHHIHSRNPEAFKATTRFCTENNMKRRSDDSFVGHFYGADISEDKLIQLIEDKIKVSNCDILEMMTHPGKSDESLEATSSYTMPREEEIRILTSTKVKNYIKDNFILVNFLEEEK